MDLRHLRRAACNHRLLLYAYQRGLAPAPVDGGPRNSANYLRNFGKEGLCKEK